MSNFIGIHHSSVIVSDTEKALQFYSKVLGMHQSRRGDLPYPGAWLAVGDQQVHLMELPNPDATTGRPEHGGRDRHIALSVRDLALIENALQQAGVNYTLSRSGRAALFCRDPDGNAIELIENAAA